MTAAGHMSDNPDGLAAFSSHADRRPDIKPSGRAGHQRPLAAIERFPEPIRLGDLQARNLRGRYAGAAAPA
jgi:hypothetical protein